MVNVQEGARLQAKPGGVRPQLAEAKTGLFGDVFVALSAMLGCFLCAPIGLGVSCLGIGIVCSGSESFLKAGVSTKTVVIGVKLSPIIHIS